MNVKAFLLKRKPSGGQRKRVLPMKMCVSSVELVMQSVDGQRINNSRHISNIYLNIIINYYYLHAWQDTPRILIAKKLQVTSKLAIYFQCQRTFGERFSSVKSN
jgi:hypothetical protein